MNISTSLCLRRFAIVEELAEGWRKDHDEAMVVYDIEELLDEYIRTCRLCQRNVDNMVSHLMDGKVNDADAMGHSLLNAVKHGLATGQIMADRLVSVKDRGFEIKNEAEFTEAIFALETVKENLLTKWPFIDYNMITESKAAYERGEHQTIEELIDELQSDRAEAG